MKKGRSKIKKLNKIKNNKIISVVSVVLAPMCTGSSMRYRLSSRLTYRQR